MGTKDITEKNLEALNDVFADIVNVLLFKGERLVNEKDLEADTTKSMFKASRFFSVISLVPIIQVPYNY